MVGAAQADRVGAALAVAAGIALPENPVERMSPEAVASEIALAWPAFLSALAAAAPLVVVIEDVHWAEPPLLEMLERVLARSTGRLLLVATARPEFADGRPAWSSRPGMSQIALDPLTDDQARALVAELLPREGAHVRERVVAAAEGNPFFAEQLASHISEKTADAAPMPNTVRALLAARIDVLPETEKRLLQDAAVVGRVFWTTTLQSVQPRRDLQRALEELEDRGLIVTRPASSLPGETEFSFCHGLTREVAYRSIPRSKRCRAHAAVGRWLEQLAGDRREEFVDLLAYHYEAAAAPGDAALAWPVASPERAQLQAKAVTALLDAGEAARKRVSLEQALGYAHRAQALAASDHDRLGALELEARTCHAALHGDEALSAYTAAMELARTVGDSVALARLRAHAKLLCVRYSGTLTGESWRTKARELVEPEPHGYSEDATFERGALLASRPSLASKLARSKRSRDGQEQRRARDRDC